MTDFQFVKYSKDKYAVWNNFLSSAKNATFLFHRDFMDYHSDRFDDFSLMIYNNKKLVALLPANETETSVFSHQGLTYGGLLYSEKLKFRVVLDMFKQLLKHLHEQSKAQLLIKKLPYVYSVNGNDELDYLLHLCKGTIEKKINLSIINLKDRIKFSDNRIEGYKRGIKNSLEIKFDDSLDLFWTEILEPNLKSKFNTVPLHTLVEITKLKTAFPDKIIQVNVYYNSKIVAGTTLFITEKTVKAQYISGNCKSNQLGSLDFMFYQLLDKFSDSKHYFDFGSSLANADNKINSGLLYWKEGLGCRTVVQTSYAVKTENHLLLNNVMV